VKAIVLFGTSYCQTVPNNLKTEFKLQVQVIIVLTY